MIASIISLLPVIVTAILSTIVTWYICRLWFKVYYVHKNEVRPLQESQHMMQNQYGILAERIKHTDIQLAEARARLLSTDTQTLVQQELEKIKPALLEALQQTLQEHALLNEGADESDKKVKEQINFIRLGLKEFKSEFVQKTNSAASQYQELSHQLWQLIELHKKLSIDADNSSRSMQYSDLDDKSVKPFTLASIKKRS